MSNWHVDTEGPQRGRVAAPLRVAVVIGSTREGRFGTTITDWFVGQLRRPDTFEVIATKALLKQLSWWGEALRAARAADPYGA